MLRPVMRHANCANVHNLGDSFVLQLRL